jgi:predicted acyltransferase
MFARILDNHCQSILSKIGLNRMLALDVFRGITITAMILVNNPGSWQHIYGPMRHAAWHGWTLTDLIFPFFIFIVGISIQFSGARMLANGTSRTKLIQHAFIRMSKLILLGWFLALFYFDFAAENYNWVEQRLLQMRFMGVLQRIGLVYFVCVVLWIYLSKRALLLSFVGLLLMYWCALVMVPYQDNAGTEYHGLLEFGNNLSAWLDSQIFNAPHLYYATATPFAFDPEGLLSTLPAIATGISGLLVGNFLTQAKRVKRDKVKFLLILGFLGVLLGELWHIILPINKALWTSSYVLLSSGYACLVLAILIYILDIKKRTVWSAPFVVFGANSIVFFMFSGILGRLLVMLPIENVSVKAWLYQHVFQVYFGMLNGSLIYALCFLALSYLCMYWLYRHNIFWKV